MSCGWSKLVKLVAKLAY
uniref:Uncharacterized protein n=1 Tax=Anguilla anguilla TaxID=7936 RepID=A0A0E9UWB7_ANGAN